MLELLEQHEPELFFGEVRVDDRDRDGVEREIHAANHGYSHLSGIDSTRIELRWRQCLLRMFCRDCGGGKRGSSPLNHLSTSKM